MNLQKILKVAVLIVIALVVLKLSYGLLNVLLATVSITLIVVIKLIPTILVIFLLIKVVQAILKK